MRRLRLAAIAVILNLIAVAASHAATVVWTGASGTDTNWSNAANWTGTPAGNDIKFFNAGAAATSNIVNNVVDADVAVASLQYGNTNFTTTITNAHTTFISSGVTLSATNTGGLIVGTGTAAGSNVNVYASINGPGSLVVNNAAANISIYQATNTTSVSSPLRATLDMSDLDNFTGSFRRLGVGSATLTALSAPQNTTGTLLLAKTNTITAGFVGSYNATGVAVTNSIEVGVNNGNPGGVDFLYLGLTNAVNADSIGVGKSKTTASMLFNPVFTNSNPVAVFRGAAGGSSRVTFWSIGDMADTGNSSGTANGTNDFTGGTVDAMVTTLSLGRDRSGNNTGSSATRGTLTFTAGAIDANTLLVGNQAFANAANSNPMAGVVNVNSSNANLIVNTSLVLGNTAAASPAATNTSGTLNINGGNVTASVITSGIKSTNSTINLNTGRLTVSTTAGTAALPITSLSASNGTFTLTVAANRTNIFTKTLTASGTANLINLAGVSGLGSYPTQIVLIKYTGAINGTFNFALGNVPTGVVGSIEDNAVNSSVDLILTEGPEPPTVRTWTGAINGNWDIATTTNWANPSASPSFYFEGDFPVFDDSASGTTDVIITTNVAPASVTISNVTKTYTFSGPGSIVGATGLLKQGSGTATILGTNTYTGGTTISNGVLQLGDGISANGSISGNVTNATSLIVANPAAQTLSGAITGSGALTKTGTGTLTLSGSNTYAGGTHVSAGTLQVGNGATGGSITGDVTDNANLTFSRSDSSVFGGIISGTGTLTKSGSGTMILNATNTYTGGTTNSAGNLVLSNNAAIGAGTMIYVGGSVQLAPGVTITNNFHIPSSTSDAMMDVSANGPAATWAGNITVSGGGQFRPAGIAGTLDLTGTGNFGGNFFIIPRGTVEIVSNANFSSTAAGTFGRNSTGNSTIVRLKGNAIVSLGGLNLGGGSFATGGRMELTLQDNASLSIGTSDFDIHNSTAPTAVSTLLLNGGTMTIGGQIKSKTGATQFSTNNFNGGKLRASKDNAAFLPASSGLVSNVRDGGAIIDDNGFSIAIALPLLHSIITGDSATDGGLTKLGTGTLALNGANTYNGLTTVSNGTLRVDGSVAGAVTVVHVSTLAGSGTIGGAVTLATGSTLAPGGSSIGTLTVVGGLTLGGNLAVEVDTSVSPSNDLCMVTGTLTNSGSRFLTVANLGPALALGDSFTLFNQPLLNGGSLTITPAPGVGLAWSNRLAIDGTIAVITNEPGSYTERIYAVTDDNQLISFQNNAPGTILQSPFFSGLQPSEQILGIDFVGETLYAVGSSSRLYTIDRTTGAATLVGQFSPVLDGAYFGMDAEPTGLRVVSQLGQQLVLSYASGAATGGPTLVGGGVSTFISGLAYHPGTGVRYVADYSANTIGTLDPATGLVTTIGLGATIDFSRNNGFDISSKSAATAYLASPASSGGAAASLYTVNLETGVAGLVGLIGDPEGVLVRGLAVGPEFSTSASVNSTPTNLTSIVTGGTNLTLAWPADHLGWMLQSQTNSRALGLKTNWVDVVGSDSTTSTNFPINKDDPTVFYRLRLLVP